MLESSPYRMSFMRPLAEDEGYKVDHNDQLILPRIASGVSGIALAASLLWDGWSLHLHMFFEDESYKVDQNDQLILTIIPTSVSGTTLAASLLRDGWSLAKMYEKYQEAAGALCHERWGKRQTVLERALREIEEKTYPGST